MKVFLLVLCLISVVFAAEQQNDGTGIRVGLSSPVFIQVADLFATPAVQGLLGVIETKPLESFVAPYNGCNNCLNFSNPQLSNTNYGGSQTLSILEGVGIGIILPGFSSNLNWDLYWHEPGNNTINHVQGNFQVTNATLNISVSITNGNGTPNVTVISITTQYQVVTVPNYNLSAPVADAVLKAGQQFFKNFGTELIPLANQLASATLQNFTGVYNITDNLKFLYKLSANPIFDQNFIILSLDGDFDFGQNFSCPYKKTPLPAINQTDAIEIYVHEAILQCLFYGGQTTGFFSGALYNFFQTRDLLPDNRLNISIGFPTPPVVNFFNGLEFFFDVALNISVGRNVSKNIEPAINVMLNLSSNVSPSILLSAGEINITLSDLGLKNLSVPFYSNTLAARYLEQLESASYDVELLNNFNYQLATLLEKAPLSIPFTAGPQIAPFIQKLQFESVSEYYLLIKVDINVP
eukprot:TRINITY_DN3687_c0_g1_i1.p1 TRINITY_DN3687_c0_g1~~TRINITY_DN3687_c0_g1_i1.p1  ORF type:complete len:465 (-),score=107.79 TRINITY_DN3687_c0_g1_i1:55-1449(-)